MSKKALAILSISVVIIAAVWGVKEWRGGRQKGTEARSITVLNSIDPPYVNEVEMEKGEEKVGLKREGDIWKVGEKEADGEKIKGALEAVKQASFTGPVARNKENHDKLGVGEQGQKVTVKQGDTNFAFRIGNSGPTFDSSYVRLEGEDDVYLADVNLGFQFSTATSSWEKKEEVKEEKEEVKD